MLPTGWSSAEVRELVDLVNGHAFKPADWGKAGRPIIRIQNLNKPGAGFNYFDGVLPEKYLVRNGDLLFAWSGTPGTSFGAHIWRGDEAWLNQHIFNVRFDERHMDKRFLRLAINQNLAEYVRAAHGGAGLAHITKGVFESSRLLVPPLPEQRRIVAEIETQLTRLDAAVAALERARANLKRYRAALLAAAVNAPLEEDQLLTWVYRPLGDLAVRSEYGTSVKCSYEATNEPVLRIPNVARGHIDLRDMKFATRPLEMRQGAPLEPGDLLMVRTNGSIDLVGRTAVVVHPMVQPHGFASYLLRFRFNASQVLASWIHLYLSSPLGREIIERHAASSAGQHNVSLSLLGKMPILLPPIEEQGTIVQEVEWRLSVVEEMNAAMSANLKRAERMRQAILRKAFTGQLVPQDPDDEPASVLLERIREERAHKTSTRVSARKRLGATQPQLL